MSENFTQNTQSAGGTGRAPSSNRNVPPIPGAIEITNVEWREASGTEAAGYYLDGEPIENHMQRAGMSWPVDRGDTTSTGQSASMPGQESHRKQEMNPSLTDCNSLQKDVSLIEDNGSFQTSSFDWKSLRACDCATGQGATHVHVPEEAMDKYDVYSTHEDGTRGSYLRTVGCIPQWAHDQVIQPLIEGRSVETQRDSGVSDPK